MTRSAQATKNGQVKRRQLVARAASLFNDVGYHAASVEDLAAACGIRKPTLYHYFRSKDEILYWIHDEFIDLLINREQARSSLNLSPSQALLEVMADILDLMRTHRGYVRVFFEHYRELADEEKAAIKVKRDAYEAAVRSIIERGVANGEFRDVEPRMATLALAGMCNWAYQWYDPEGPLSSREVAQVFWRILIGGIAEKSA
jgi:AcrR family transcriptional regulator